MDDVKISTAHQAALLNAVRDLRGVQYALGDARNRSYTEPIPNLPELLGQEADIIRDTLNTIDAVFRISGIVAE